MLEAAAKAPNPAADWAALADAPKVVSTPEVINGLLEIAADAGSVKPEEGVVDGPAKFEPSVAAGAPARMYIKWWCLLAIHHTEKGNLTPILKKRKERLRLLALMSFPVAYYLMGNEDTTLISSLASNPKRTVIRGHVTGWQNIFAPALFFIMILLLHGTVLMQSTAAVSTHALWAEANSQLDPWVAESKQADSWWVHRPCEHMRVRFQNQLSLIKPHQR